MEEHLAGPFIEIIVSSAVHSDSARAQARERCFSIIGLLALIIGEQLLNGPIYEETFFYDETDDLEHGVVDIPIRAVVPRSVHANEISQFLEAATFDSNHEDFRSAST